GTWTEGSWESRTLPSEGPLLMNINGGFFVLFRPLEWNIELLIQFRAWQPKGSSSSSFMYEPK
ncbi:hypothetical protein, partial [Paenibacillus sp. Y412MC10]|uniref:hypothetical protein n=1 Tax=Geobacillus sp. (strain Y412MC10) TaxID=481743 RepID=UPI001C92D6B1